MDIVKFVDLLAYARAGSSAIETRQLQGDGASTADFVLVAHATLSPKARMPLEFASVDHVYVVAQGVLTVEQANGIRHVLAQGDSVFVPANEGCALANDGDRTASLIMITPPTATSGPPSTCSFSCRSIGLATDS